MHIRSDAAGAQPDVDGLRKVPDEPHPTTMDGAANSPVFSSDVKRHGRLSPVFAVQHLKRLHAPVLRSLGDSNRRFNASDIGTPRLTPLGGIGASNHL
jgi:hypothetical protein